MKHVRGVMGLALMFAVLSAGAEDAHPDLPKVGMAAPALGFTKVLQAPASGKVDWASLKGKTVVLEFWATWCVPCVAEIPVMNALVAASDPAKVQFISVDDEEQATVEGFLKKHAMSGWIGLDTTGTVYERFGVEARPTTMVIGPEGKVASTTVRPEELKAEQLVALAEGKPVTLGGAVDAKVKAALSDAISKGFAAEAGGPVDADKALFSITLSPGSAPKKGDEPETRILSMGPGKMDILDGDVKTLLAEGTGVAQSRIKTVGTLPETLYKLHIAAPDADAKRLAQAVELAIANGAGVRIEHRTSETDAYVLTTGANETHLAEDTDGKKTGFGFAFYDKKKQVLQAMNASAEQMAGALEEALGMPVVNESGFKGRLMGRWTVTDLAGAEKVLAENGGLTLVKGKRPIETVTVTAVTKPGAVAAVK